MNHSLATLAVLAMTTCAFAQAPPTDAPAAALPAAPAAPVAAGPPEAAASGPGSVKALRTSCRDEATSKGLKGPAMREAISACVVRQRPDLAGREQCRTDGFGKGLRKEELRAFVKDCVKTKG